MDVVLLGFIAGFIYGGYRSGFLKRLFGIVFAVIAFLASAYLRYPVGAILQTFFKDITADYAELVAAIIVFPAVLAALHLASRSLIDRINVQGVTKELDAILGAVFGFIEAILILSVAVVLVDTYFGTSSTLPAVIQAGPFKSIVEAFNASQTVHILRQTTVPIVLTILGPFLPKDLSTVVPKGLPGEGAFPFPSGLPIA